MTDRDLRERICAHARSLFERGLTSGSTGNISVRAGDGWLMTPTGASFGALEPARLSRLDADGRHVDGDAPTKEAVLHLAVYAERPRAAAVVHLHSTFAVAVSCLAGIDPADALPPLTAYFVMRIGKLPLVPYHPPGDDALAAAVRAAAAGSHAILLANHGPVVAGASLEEAVYATEELEETARLHLLTHGMRTQPLTAAQTADLHARFPARC